MKMMNELAVPAEMVALGSPESATILAGGDFVPPAPTGNRVLDTVKLMVAIVVWVSNEILS
jgi:hypothetical protein